MSDSRVCYHGLTHPPLIPDGHTNTPKSEPRAGEVPIPLPPNPETPRPGNVYLYVSFILAWVAVEFWIRFLDNFLFGTMGIDKKSTLATFVIALVISLAIIYFFYIDLK